MYGLWLNFKSFLNNSSNLSLSHTHQGLESSNKAVYAFDNAEPKYDFDLSFSESNKTN